MTRFALGGGVVFAVLAAAGLLMQAIAFGGAEEESRAEVIARYSDGGNELLVEVGALLLGFAVASALPFLASLRGALRSVEGERSVVSTTVVAGGVVMVVMLAASSVATVAAFSSYDFYDAYEVDPDVVLLMQTVSFSALGFALVGGAALVGAIAVVALRTRLLPRWLAVAGLGLAAVLLFGEWALILFVPLPLLLLWLLALSIVLVLRPQRAGLATGDPVDGHM